MKKTKLWVIKNIERLILKSKHSSVTVILPIRNEAANIENCLKAILKQNYSGKIEILIIDGMSTDNTPSIIRKFSSNLPMLNIKILDNPGKIVPTGMNIALRQVRSEVVIRIDGHTFIERDYIKHCVEILGRKNVDNVGGRMVAIGITPFGKAVAVATSTPFGVGGSRFHYSEKEEWVDSVYMGAWKREVFEKNGLFDEELVRNQDDEFNYRLRKNGGKILLSPKIKSEYTVRSNPKALWKQYFQYGFWKVRVLQKHPAQMSLRHFVPPIFVFSLLSSLLIALFFPIIWYVFGLIVTLYLVANLFVSIFTCIKKGWYFFFYLPFVYSILHISYGTGFLAGLIKFVDRWGDKEGKVPRLSDFENQL